MDGDDAIAITFRRLQKLSRFRGILSRVEYSVIKGLIACEDERALSYFDSPHSTDAGVDSRAVSYLRELAGTVQ
jgi:hypothetical protein